MKLSDAFQAARIDEGLKYEIYVMSPCYSGAEQLIRGPVLDEGDWKNKQVCVMRQGQAFPDGSDAQFVGYVSALPEWAKEEPKTIRELLKPL